MSLKTLSKALAVTSLLWWGCFCYLTNHYDATRPTLFDVASGRIHPLNSHGHVVYLNGSETFRVYGLVCLAVTFFASGFLIDRKTRRSSDTSN